MSDKMKTRLIARACLQEVSAEEAALIEIPARAIAQGGLDLEDQRDLLRMTSVLVSTGMNLNDDVFLREEILPARSTGAHKPVNIEHDETQIIGHMLRTFVTAKSGERIEEDDIRAALEKDNFSKLPDDLDITNESVIYSYILPDIARDIKSKAVAGELFVSVEAWFTAFDFLVGNKIVARNEDTAPILDPTLKANGGAGSFRGQMVGRVLRNILFGGIGVVEKPANPESVIRSVGMTNGVTKLVELDVESMDEVLAKHVVGSLEGSTSKKEEEDMSKEGTLTRENLLEEVSAIMKAKEADKTVPKTSAADDDQVTPVIPSEGSSELKGDVDSLRKENQTLSERIRHFEVKELTRERSDALKDVGLSDKQVKARITKAVAFSEEDFTQYLEDVKDLVSADKQSADEGGSEDNKAQASKDDESDEEGDAETKVTASEDEDEEISLDLGDIDQVDAEIPTKSNGSAGGVDGAGDLVDRFAKALTPLLAKQNPKVFGRMAEAAQ